MTYQNFENDGTESRTGSELPVIRAGSTYTTRTNVTNITNATNVTNITNPHPNTLTQNEFKHSIFGCFNNFKTCLITSFFPCWTYSLVISKFKPNQGLKFGVIMGILVIIGKTLLIRTFFGFSGIVAALGIIILVAIFYLYYELRILVKMHRRIPLKTMNDMLAALFCQYCILCQSMQEYDIEAMGTCNGVETV